MRHSLLPHREPTTRSDTSRHRFFKALLCHIQMGYDLLADFSHAKFRLRPEADAHRFH